MDKYSGPERRRERQAELQSIHARLDEGERRFQAGDARMGGLEKLVEANTALTQQTADTVARIDENTSGFVAFSNDLVAGTKFLCRCARGVQWTAEMLRRYLMLILLLMAAYAYSTNQQAMLETLFKFLKA